MPYAQTLRASLPAGCCVCTQGLSTRQSGGEQRRGNAFANPFGGQGGASLSFVQDRLPRLSTTFKKYNLSLPRASIAEAESAEDEGDYALPSLDFDDLTGGRASKERAKKAKQEAADAKLLEAWDSSQMAKESTYDILGTQGGGERGYAGWRAVEPAEYVAKIGIYDQKKSVSTQNKPSLDVKLPPGWELDLEEEEPAQLRKGGRKRRGKELEQGVDDQVEKPSQQSANDMRHNRGPREGVRASFRKADAKKRAETMRPQLRVANGNQQYVAVEDFQGLSRGSKESGQPQPAEASAALQEEWSLNSWDLGLPDEQLVKEFLKQAPLKKLPRSGSFEMDEGPSFAAEFKNLEGGEGGSEEELGMPLEELEAKARALEERLGLRKGQNGKEASTVSLLRRSFNLDPSLHLQTREAATTCAKKAPPLDDYTLLAQFDKIMGGQLQQSDKQLTAPPTAEDDLLQKREHVQRRKDRWMMDEDEDPEEIGEDLQRIDDLLKGRKVPGLVPQARARLEAEKKFEDSDAEDSDLDEDEQIEEQFIQDPDWQDGWGDDMYLNIDEEMEKAKKARASKRAKKGARSIVDLRRSDKSLVGRLNDDGTLSIEASQESQENGRPVRGIEDLSRGSRKRVDPEKEKRDSDAFIQGLYKKAERTKGGRKLAKRDAGSTWETPEMLAEREKELAHQALEEELAEEETMLEVRHERVMEQFNLIDRLVHGDEDFGESEEVATSSEALAEEIDGSLLAEFDADSAVHAALGSDLSEQEAEQRRAVESLAMGGLWADLDDQDYAPSRSDGRAASSNPASTLGSKGANASFGHLALQERTVSDEVPQDADRLIATTSGRQGGEPDASNGRSLSAGDERDVRKGRDIAQSKQPTLEQLRPSRMRKSMRETPEKDSPEMVISGYPELELEEELDPLTGVVRQVVRHVGAPPHQVEEEERRESTRLAQSLTAERDEAAEANLLVDRMLNAGEQVEEMIQQLGREKRLDGNILRAIDRKIGSAKRNKEDQVCETLDILYRYIEAEMERQNASPGLRLLDELLQLDDGTLDEATWLRQCRDRMREEFVPEGRIDIFNPPGVPKPRPDGSWEYPEQEGILRIDFIREVDDLLRDLEEQQREFTQASGFTAEAIAARLVVEQKMRTAAQLRKLKRNAAMLQI